MESVTGSLGGFGGLGGESTLPLGSDNSPSIPQTGIGLPTPSSGLGF